MVDSNPVFFSFLNSLSPIYTSVMSAAQLFGAVLSTSPENPFVAIAYTLYQSLYSPMSTFYMRSLSALHGLYAV